MKLKSLEFVRSGVQIRFFWVCVLLGMGGLGALIFSERHGDLRDDAKLGFEGKDHSLMSRRCSQMYVRIVISCRDDVVG